MFPSHGPLTAALSETPRLTLAFYSYGMLVRREDDGAIREYPVNPAEVAAALGASVSFDTGVLDPSILAVREDGTTRTVAGWRKPQVTALWLEGALNPVRVPLPGLVLVRTATADRDPRHRVYAAPARPTSYADPLYHAPLPNIYSSGGICWGSVPTGADLAADWDALFATPFGSHSVSGKCASHRDDIRKLYADLEARKARRYPKRELVPANVTLGMALGVGT